MRPTNMVVLIGNSEIDRKAEILNEDILMVGNDEVSLGGIRPCCLTRKQAN